MSRVSSAQTRLGSAQTRGAVSTAGGVGIDRLRCCLPATLARLCRLARQGTLTSSSSQPLSADKSGSVHIVLLIEIFHTWKESKILCRLGLETLSTSLLPTHPLTRAMSTDNCTPRAVGIEDIMELSEETDWKLPQPLLKYPTPKWQLYSVGCQGPPSHSLSAENCTGIRVQEMRGRSWNGRHYIVVAHC